MDQLCQPFPLIVKADREQSDLTSWARSHPSVIEAELLSYGAILFRGFDVNSVAGFNQFAGSISAGGLLDYFDQHTPRTKIADHVYTSTEYPPDQRVPFHSENSRNHVWPMKIWFFCLVPPDKGGETPIADNRKVYALLDLKIIERFAEKGVMYVRNFGEGIGVSWQSAFQSLDKKAVELQCHKTHLEFAWKDNDRLKVRHVCQAIATHPVTREKVWFNQAHLFHLSSLEPEIRESLLELFEEDELPSNAYYGDGSPIEISILEEIRGAYEQAATSFTWQERDVLMLDNMLMAHGRAPYDGKRTVLVAMADLYGESPAAALYKQAAN